jgi:ketosteroid isomerase-like protein
MALSKESQQTQEVLNGFLQSMGANDIAQIAKYFWQSASFYIAESPYMPWTGKKTGRQEILAALQQLTGAHKLDEDDFEMAHIFIDGSEAAIFVKAGRTVKSTGKKFKEPFSMRLTIENGLITKFQMLEDSHQIEKAFKNG